MSMLYHRLWNVENWILRRLSFGRVLLYSMITKHFLFKTDFFDFIKSIAEIDDKYNLLFQVRMWKNNIFKCNLLLGT